MFNYLYYQCFPPAAANPDFGITEGCSWMKLRGCSLVTPGHFYYVISTYMSYFYVFQFNDRFFSRLFSQKHDTHIHSTSIFWISLFQAQDTPQPLVLWNTS